MVQVAQGITYKYLLPRTILADEPVKTTLKIDAKNIARNLLQNHIEETKIN